MLSKGASIYDVYKVKILHFCAMQLVFLQPLILCTLLQYPLLLSEDIIDGRLPAEISLRISPLMAREDEHTKFQSQTRE